MWHEQTKKKIGNKEGRKEVVSLDIYIYVCVCLYVYVLDRHDTSSGCFEVM